MTHLGITIACCLLSMIAAFAAGWRLGYGVGFDDGDMNETICQAERAKRFDPWPW